MNGARWQAVGIALAVFALDRATKLLVEARISAYDTIPVIPNVFNLVYTRNRGAAFGILQTAPEAIRLLLLVGLALGVLAMIGWMLWQGTRPASPATTINRIALSLVMGGAIGNLYDRILQGSVTDFLQFFIGSYEWPSFNVADSSIFVGAVLMAVDILFLSRKQASTNHAPETH